MMATFSFVAETKRRGRPMWLFDEVELVSCSDAHLPAVRVNSRPVDEAPSPHAKPRLARALRR
jgi:hypothetical protein